MIAETAVKTSRAWVCDDAFLRAVADGIDGIAARVATDRHFDIEVLLDPHVDAPLRHDADRYDTEQVEAMRNAVLARVRKLREPFGDRPPELVLVCGSPTVEPPAEEDGRAASPAPQLWEDVAERLVPQPESDRALLCVSGALEGGWPASPPFVSRWEEGNDSPVELVAAVFRVFRPSQADELFAHVAALGFLPVEGADARAQQYARAARLVRDLATTVGRQTPLYVLAARRAALGADGDAFLRELERLRVSLLVAGSSGRPDVVTLLRASRVPHGTDVTLVAPPTFRRGSGVPGLARIRIDISKGQAEVTFKYDRGSDRPEPPRQVVRPLASASRVTPGERRLRTRMDELLDGAEVDVTAFRAYVHKTWEAEGYVPLVDAGGRLPDLRPTRVTRYKLLLLLRERDDGSYDILLSRHTPRSPAAVAEWDTLLMPAFTKVRLLLERLRDDVVRQSIERSEDLERAERARSFEEAVERIVAAERAVVGDVWGDELREVAQTRRLKVSPTEGVVTAYEYQLVTLLPLVERYEHEGDGRSRAGERPSDAARVADWLARLETVDVEALEPGGAGLRADPETTLADAGVVAPARGRLVPRGAVWFPLGDPRAPAWRSCPSLVARNADVMQWVDETLAAWRRKDGTFPPELVLSKATPGPASYELVEEFPFQYGR